MHLFVGMLGITTDENWKDFAKHLGFTKREIKDKLGSTTDPFALIMGVFQARGGAQLLSLVVDDVVKNTVIILSINCRLLDIFACSTCPTCLFCSEVHRRCIRTTNFIEQCDCQVVKTQGLPSCWMTY